MSEHICIPRSLCALLLKSGTGTDDAEKRVVSSFLSVHPDLVIPR